MAGIVMSPRAGRRRAAAPAWCSIEGAADVAQADLAEVPLWLREWALADGAAVRHGPTPGDEALFVVEGELAVAAGEHPAPVQVCPAGGAVLVGAGAALGWTARGGTRVVHLGAASPQPSPSPPGGPPLVRVVGPDGLWARVDDERATRFFADSDAEGCAITLFTTGRSGAYRSAAHSHSAPEVLYVLDGSIRFGRRRLRPGDAVAIEADRRYGFASDGAFTFLNYRPGPSRMTVERGGEPVPEGARAHGFPRVGDRRTP